MIESAWCYQFRPVDERRATQAPTTFARRHQRDCLEGAASIARAVQDTRRGRKEQRPDRHRHRQRTSRLHLGHWCKDGDQPAAYSGGGLNPTTCFQKRQHRRRPRGSRKGESSSSHATRSPDQIRALSQRQLPTDHDCAVPTREYQSDQPSQLLPRLPPMLPYNRTSQFASSPRQTERKQTAARQLTRRSISGMGWCLYLNFGLQASEMALEQLPRPLQPLHAQHHRLRFALRVRDVPLLMQPVQRAQSCDFQARAPNSSASKAVNHNSASTVSSTLSRSYSMPAPGSLERQAHAYLLCPPLNGARNQGVQAT